MVPVLSLVVCHHNQVSTLPRLLDGVFAQSLRELEVVLIDDCSDEDCSALVDAYKAKGLPLRFFRGQSRLFTKEARLKGIELAQGDIIAFADADDELLGTDVLERHVYLFREKGCDVLHFRTLYMDGEKREYRSWADPFAAELRGDAVFRAYAGTFPGHLMWNKLYSRALWLRLLQTARDIPITVCSEDLFLSSLYLLHARHYIGSALAGYVHHYENKLAVKAPGRALAFHILRRRFVPYLRSRACPEDAARAFSGRIDILYAHYVNLMCREAVRGLRPGALPRREIWAEFGLDEKDFLAVLLEANALNADMLTAVARMV